MSSLVEYLEDQENLEKQAREQMPYDPNECTFPKGPLRQELYACLTCYRSTKQLNAICYACSIKCHTSHELVELFTKRSFTCDCGTSKVKGPCLVRYPQWSKLMNDSQFNDQFEPDIPDSNNRYNHNFKGLFCDCNNHYNPLTDSNMIQCILGLKCDEDWFHEECIMGLRPGVINRNPKSGTNKLNELSEPGLDAKTENEEKIKQEGENKNNKKDQDEEKQEKQQQQQQQDDSDDEAYDVLPLPGFPSLDSFETIICWKCANEYPQEMDELIKYLDCETIEHVPAETLDKRIQKLSSLNDKDLEHSSKRSKKSHPKTIFLKQDYKDNLTEFQEKYPASKLSLFLKKYPFLYQDDPIYRPPDDGDDSSSVFELGIRELNNLPSDKAAEGLAAYEKIKSKLTEFLKPFAEEGKVVTADEVKAFFNTETRK